MKFKFVSILTLVLIIPIIAMVLPGCTRNQDVEFITIPQNTDNLSWVQTWGKILESTRVQDVTADLSSFQLRVDGSGSISFLYFVFSGIDNAQERKLYFVSNAGPGRLAWYGGKGHIDVLNYDPARLFTALDMVGIRAITPGEDGFSLNADLTGGNIGFSNANADLFSITDGQLVPLKSVRFNTSQWVLSISILKMYSYVIPGTDENGNPHNQTITTSQRLSPEQISNLPNLTVTVQPTTTIQVPAISVNANPESSEDRAQIWFLNEDLVKAESVEYLP